MAIKGHTRVQLAQLNTPQKIQSFLEELPFNHERKGETCMSAYRVLEERKAHCIEGAFLACACLIAQGRKPLIVSLKVKHPDDDHIIVLFTENGYYGALSKTNHPVLRYRDPIYKSVRELVMSYFHEYFLYENGEKTLLGYTRTINLRRYGTKWITAQENVWDIGEKVYNMPIISIVPPMNKRLIRNATLFERTTLNVKEWK